MRMVVIIALPAVLLLIAAAAWFRFTLASGGASTMFGARESAQEVKTIDVSHAPTLIVDSDGGSVQLTSGANGSIRVTAQKYAPTHEEAEKMAFTVDKRDNTISVSYKTPDNRHGNRHIDFKIEAPRDTVLEITTGGGNIQAFGFSQGVHARTGGGDVQLADVEGDLRVDTGGGNVRCGGVNGTLDLTTGGGDIAAEGWISGHANLTSGGGNINVQSVHGTLIAETGSGDIYAAGRLSGESRISSGSGNVKVEIPPDPDLGLHISTDSGSIQDNFGLQGHTVRAGGGTLLSAQLGAGSSSLGIQTGNGDVTIERG